MLDASSAATAQQWAAAQEAAEEAADVERALSLARRAAAGARLDGEEMAELVGIAESMLGHGGGDDAS